MKLVSEIFSKKFSYRYKIDGEKTARSFSLAGLAEDATDDQIAMVADAVQPLINGKMEDVRITVVNTATQTNE